jgi:hypothetical protein
VRGLALQSMLGVFARGALRCPTLLRQESVEKRAALTTSVKAKVCDNLADKDAQVDDDTTERLCTDTLRRVQI